MPSLATRLWTLLGVKGHRRSHIRAGSSLRIPTVIWRRARREIAAVAMVVTSQRRRSRANKGLSRSARVGSPVIITSGAYETMAGDADVRVVLFSCCSELHQNQMVERSKSIHCDNQRQICFFTATPTFSPPPFFPRSFRVHLISYAISAMLVQ